MDFGIFLGDFFIQQGIKAASVHRNTKISRISNGTQCLKNCISKCKQILCFITEFNPFLNWSHGAVFAKWAEKDDSRHRRERTVRLSKANDLEYCIPHHCPTKFWPSWLYKEAGTITLPASLKPNYKTQCQSLSAARYCMKRMWD